jgi:DNA-directed RNA polymerase specialized sigma24 family protein
MALDELLRFTRALTGDRGLAEDIGQDVLLRLHTRTGSPIDNLDAYAPRMAINTYISWRRKWQRITPVKTVGMSPNPTIPSGTRGGPNCEPRWPR